MSHRWIAGARPVRSLPTTVRPMPRRRSLIALVTAALALVALPAGRAALGSAEPAPSRGSDVAAAITRSLSVPAVVAARLTSDDRFEKARSERSVKQGLLLFGLLAAVLALAALGRHQSFLAVHQVRFRSSSWSPQSGRAPPALHLTIA